MTVMKKDDDDAKMDVDGVKPAATTEEGSTKRRNPAAETLLEVVRKVEQGDRHEATERLHQFVVRYLTTLRDQHVSGVIPLLVEIGVVAAQKYAEVARRALELARNLAKSRPQAVVAPALAIVVRLTDEKLASAGVESKSSNLFDAHTVQSEFLALLVVAVRAGVLTSPPARQFVRRHATSALHTAVDQPSRRRVAVELLVELHRQDELANEITEDEGEIRLAVSNKAERAAALESLEELLTTRAAVDRDPRVRRAAAIAFRALATSSSEAARFDLPTLSLKAYRAVKKLCADSDASTRTDALHALHNFTVFMGDRMVVDNDANRRTTLVDDAFAVACQAVNDGVTVVRAEAAALLGRFEGVSDAVLEQTLDKKVHQDRQESHDRRGGGFQGKSFALSNTTSHATARKRLRLSRKKDEEGGDSSSTADEWSRGKILHEAAPSTSSAGGGGGVSYQSKKGGGGASTTGVMSMGAAGAFVTALEDEFQDVRRAAVYALGKLAVGRADFAAQALDHLTDMFNDEIADVRLDAIYALRPLVTYSVLTRDQLDIILKCLDDASMEARAAVRALLAKAELADVPCVQAATRALVNCQARFAHDTSGVHECMSALGAQHPTHVHAMAAGLLELHAAFEPQQHNINDTFYIGRLLMVLAAAAKHPPIVALLPEYVRRHYRYLRATRPNLVAPIAALERQTRTADGGGGGSDADGGGSRAMTTSVGESKAETLLMEFATRAAKLDELQSPADRKAVRRHLQQDVLRAGELGALSVCVSRLLAGALSLQNVLDGRATKEPADQLADRAHALEVLLRQSANIGAPLKRCLAELVLHARILTATTPQALDRVIGGWRQRKPADGVSSETAALLEQIGGAQLNDDDDVDGVVKFSVKQKSELLALVRAHRLRFPAAAQLVGSFTNARATLKTAEIVEPSPDVATSSDRVHRFIAQLPSSVSFCALLRGLTLADRPRLRVDIRYPDGTRDRQTPNPARDLTHLHTWTELEPDEEDGTPPVLLRLAMRLTLQATGVWQQPALVDIRVGLVEVERQSLQQDGAGKDRYEHEELVPLVDFRQPSEAARTQLLVHPVRRV